MSASNIKGLQVMLNKLISEHDLLKFDINRINNELSLKKQSITNIKRQIELANSPALPTMTEHAYIRYFERVKGYSLSEIDSLIITPDLIKLIKTLGGTGTYPCEGFSIVMKDFRIVTITN